MAAKPRRRSSGRADAFEGNRYTKSYDYKIACGKRENDAGGEIGDERIVPATSGTTRRCGGRRTHITRTGLTRFGSRKSLAQSQSPRLAPQSRQWGFSFRDYGKLRLPGRKLECECATTTRTVRVSHRSALRFCDLPRNRKAEPRDSSVCRRRLRSVERLEDAIPLFRRYSGSAICHNDQEPIGRARRADDD